jgi:tripartite-type tricarboxylate transporter receptor subunit TctC
MKILSFILAVASFSSTISFAQVNNYKDTRPVKIQVITSPGGSADLIGRVIAEKLGIMTGRTYLVENRVGAGGNVASEYVARSAPDGNTLLITANNHNVNPVIYAKVPYDPEKDFVPIIQVGQGPSVLAVHPSTKINTVQELIAMVKAKPNTYSYGSGGIGNPGHIQGELLKHLAGIDILHIAYKGAAPAMADAVAGQIPIVFGSMGSALPFVKSGKLKVLGTTSAKRSPLAPEFPTIAEGGVAGYEYDLWWGVFAAAGTPTALVNQYNEDIAKILAMPDVREKMLINGIEPVGKSSNDFANFIKNDLAKAKNLARVANIKAE